MNWGCVIRLRKDPQKCLYRRENDIVYMAFAIAGIIVVVSIGVLMPGVKSEAMAACTTEAKLCPDGSFVGRVSEKCEFASCPGDAVSENYSFEPDAAAGGIAGDVVLGPRCPVIGPGMEEQCADKGYQTTLFMKTIENGREVARIPSGADGRFRIALAPGEYTVTPLPGARRYPTCMMQT